MAVLTVAVMAVPSTATSQSSPLPVFPGAKGFGTATVAARGGSVYRVTNLADSGAGSLRAALSASGPRVVIFETSGTIILTSTLQITNPYLTIAGQTAPSPGITINPQRGIRLETHDVLIQHVRVRRGDDTGDNEQDTVWVRNGAYNIVFSHCSLSWGVDGTLDFNAASGAEPQNVAVLDSIISETLQNSVYALGTPHSRAMLLNNSVNGTATIARNLYAHNWERNPEMWSGWRTMFVNNVIYNGEGASAHSGFSGYFGGSANAHTTTWPVELVHVGNVAIAGLNTPANSKTIRIQNLYPGSTVYLANNFGFGMTGATGNAQWAGVFDSGTLTNQASFRINAPPTWYAAFAMPELPTTGNVARDYVLANAGARPTDRDSVDSRVVSDVRNGTGRIIDSPRQVGGFPQLAVNRRPLVVPANPNGDDDGDGYTNLEEWLHTLAAAVEGGEPPAEGGEPVPAAPRHVRFVTK